MFYKKNYCDDRDPMLQKKTLPKVCRDQSKHAWTYTVGEESYFSRETNNLNGHLG